jgi:SAM-dependent methyltransferase
MRKELANGGARSLPPPQPKRQWFLGVVDTSEDGGSTMSRIHWFGGALLLALIVATGTLSFADDKAKDDGKPDIHFVPTPQEAVDKMLEVAKVTKDDVVYDLGCGDGRIVCTAAKKYKCKAFGFDIDPERIKDSEANKAKLDKDIQKLVKFEKKNIFSLDLSKASVITLYLLPSLNVKLIPQLKKLKDGSRIVSHDFDMAGVTPDKGFPIDVKTSEGTSRVYKWTTPLKLEKE